MTYWALHMAWLRGFITRKELDGLRAHWGWPK